MGEVKYDVLTLGEVKYDVLTLGGEAMELGITEKKRDAEGDSA